MKKCLQEFGEIETCSQFYQHFGSSFYADILSTKLQSQTVIKEKLLYKKTVCKMLLKLKPAWAESFEQFLRRQIGKKFLGISSPPSNRNPSGFVST